MTWASVRRQGLEPRTRWMTKYRHGDGTAREVQRHGRTRGVAERKLAEAIRDRAVVHGAGPLRSEC